MITDYTALSDTRTRELELEQRLERRRIAAERAVAQFGGDRIALAAHLARRGRTAGRVATA